MSTDFLSHLAGEIKFGRYHKSFDSLAQIIFIRHGEKVCPLALVCSGVTRLVCSFSPTIWRCRSVTTTPTSMTKGTTGPTISTRSLGVAQHPRAPTIHLM